MSQYKPSQNLLPQLEQLLSASTQTMQFPYPALQSQFRHRPANSQLDYLNLSKTADPRNSQSFDSLAEPTKRIKHTQQSFTEAPANSKDNPRISQTPEKVQLPKPFSNLAFDNNMLNNELMEEFKAKYMSSQVTTPKIGFDEGLAIPGLNNLSPFRSQGLPYQAYLRMLQQLEQQEAEYNLQQQIIMQLNKQQRQYESLAQHQMMMQKIDPKIIQLYQMAQQSKLNSMNQNSTQMLSRPKQGIQEDDYQQLLMSANAEKFSNFKQTLINTEEPNTSSTADVSRPKREESEEEGSQNVKVETLDESSVEAKQKYIRIKATEDDDLQDEIISMKQNNLKQGLEDIQKEKGKVGQKTRKPRQPKPTKPVEIPQHMQDDRLVDYQGLMYQTLTNDPFYFGSENPKSNYNKFIMINKRAHVLSGQIHDTRVGNRYQVNVSEYKGALPGKRRNPKVIWRSDIVKDEDLEIYFNELGNIFSSDNINQEHALRLLKRKKYRREKVAVNIGKSKKFYAKVLVVPTENFEIVPLENKAESDN